MNNEQIYVLYRTALVMQRDVLFLDCSDCTSNSAMTGWMKVSRGIQKERQHKATLPMGFVNSFVGKQLTAIERRMSFKTKHMQPS